MKEIQLKALHIKIKIGYNSRIFIWALSLCILAAVLLIHTESDLRFLAAFVPACFLLRAFRLEIDEKYHWIWTILLLAAGAVFTVYNIQSLLLKPDLFAKMTRIKWFYNILIALALYLLVQIFTGRAVLTGFIAHSAIMVFAMTDYFVYSFRGTEFSFSDIAAAATGLSVASNYKFSLEPRAVYALLLSVLYLTLIRRTHLGTKRKWCMRGVCLAGIGIIFAYVALATSGVNTETWEIKGTYRNGNLLNFALEIRDSHVSAPDNYSKELIAALEEKYDFLSDDYSESGVEKPTIIAIMNESFADLSVLGELQTNIPLTPFLDSLSENTIRGYALSSVYAAKTPNSEWEFMTNNSMAFLPSGSVVYQQYIREKPSSLVSTLSNEGYTCVAMHPYYETGWSRNRVYPNLGFDETYFIDYFDQTKLMRDYITDEELYDKIIDRYESSPDNEDLFIMAITMQNHGGYRDQYDNFDQYVYKTGLSYTDANQYLQLVHESDKALEKLITYFEQEDKPVEVIFFGDHQPGLNSAFYEMMNGKGLSGLSIEELEALYTVSFFIWTNYDTEEEQVDITSLNYLSTLALERANISLPAYNQFMADMMEVIPAINSRGYYSKTAGGYRFIEDAEGEEAEWISNYNCLEYDNMFARKPSEKFSQYLKEDSGSDLFDSLLENGITGDSDTK